MPRRPKSRNICFFPQSENAGEPALLPLEELEALRLADFEGLEQNESACRMGISRGTFQRILYRARRRVAEALISGRPIRPAADDDPVAVRCCGQGTACRYCRHYREFLRDFNCQREERIMIVAVTCENNQVFQHFGRTPEFAIFRIEDGKVTAREIVPTGECGHGALAGFLQERSVDLLICGGIGGGAQQALADAGILLIGGVEGDVDRVAADFAAGVLANNPDFSCNHHHHDHEGDCHCGKH